MTRDVVAVEIVLEIEPIIFPSLRVGQKDTTGRQAVKMRKHYAPSISPIRLALGELFARVVDAPVSEAERVASDFTPTQGEAL
jgi:hypothetical protein